ncbi:MAG: hypothetical protein ACTSQP_16965 [Promethearchaeota archaeon]
MIKVSNRIKISMMRKALKLEEDVFLDNLFKWAEEFGFKIDGDYIIINRNSLSER